METFRSFKNPSPPVVVAATRDHLENFRRRMLGEALPALSAFVQAVECGNAPTPAQARTMLALLTGLDTGLRQLLDHARIVVATPDEVQAIVDAGAPGA